MRPLVLGLGLALLAGCADGGGEPCGYEVIPEVSGPRGVFELNESFLERHPTLQDIFHSEDLPLGAGSPVDCEEGARAIQDFEAHGADVRRHDSYGGDLYVRYDGATYFVNAAMAVSSQ